MFFFFFFFWRKKKIGENSKNSKFRYKSSEYHIISPGFLLIQKENGNSNMFGKFQHLQIFFKMANFKCLKIEKGCIHPPQASDFDGLGLPYPRVSWYPQFFFFMKMTAKDVKEITYMPLVTFFSVLERPRKNRKGFATTPLVATTTPWTEVLRCVVNVVDQFLDM